MMVRTSVHRFNGRRRGFTLVELLVVIGIIASLLAILMPALVRARQEADALKCMSNLRQIAMGMVMYSDTNHGFIIPAYNLPRTGSSGTNDTGGPNQPLDGWAPILDRDGFVSAGQTPNQNSVFYCPDTVDLEGMANGQTGTNTVLPQGWIDWPLVYTSVGGDSEPMADATIPSRGFNYNVRVSYWINSYNPIGGPPGLIQTSDVYYTTSVGLGPDPAGHYLTLHRVTSLERYADVITLADGVYMGRQSSTQLGQANCRIGYRHPGMGLANGSANVAFADGHVERINGNSFPQALSSSDSAATHAQKRLANLTGPTVYANPDQAMGPN